MTVPARVRASFLVLAGSSRCAGCGRSGTLLCERCTTLWPPVTAPTIAGARHVVAATGYETAARRLVLSLKRGANRDAAVPLARLMHRAAIQRRLSPGVVTWVPGRVADVRSRGYDHASILAGMVAESLGVPAQPLLERVRARPRQAGSSRAERQLNARRSFVAVPHPGPVLLVDDVLTTGATATACVSALTAAGCGPIDVLVACRA